VDDGGKTALLWASSLEPEISALLLQSSRVSSDLAREALLKASSEGNLPVMRSLLDRHVAIQPSREGGESALLQAAFNPAAEALELLLHHPKCAVNYRGGNLLETALMTAARTGGVDKVRLLLDHGADPAVMDVNGRTAVNHAAIRADTEILALLQRAGARLEHADSMGRTPLHNAIHDAGSPPALVSRAQTVRWLLEHGLDADRTDNAGMTPLMYAAMEAAADIVSLLLAAGARLDRRDELGRSALMHALYHGTDYGLNERYARPRLESADPAVPVIRQLLAAGADPEGEAALACARQWRWPGTVEMLRDAAGPGRSPKSKAPSGSGH
jgi:ankyrin repeat protein